MPAFQPDRAFPDHRPMSRRGVVRGIAGGGLGVSLALHRHRSRASTTTTTIAVGATPVATPQSMVALSDAVLQAFSADVEAALKTFKAPGTAVALVQGDDIVFARGFGTRDLANDAPVTPRTRFRVGSVTKSMTALLLGTLADEGVLAWDDRVVDLWPEFRAPTDELTQTLRLRDLLGMGSGLAESVDRSVAVVEFFMMAGETSAIDVLRAVADLPVIALPGGTFSYNNTLVSAAAFVGLLAAGASADELETAYAAAVRERVFAPLGMADAAIAEDPRPLGDDYAVGYTRDLFDVPSPLPFVPLAGIAPAGSGLASAEDLGRYLVAQLNGGVGPDGSRVVSAANLAAQHQPGIAIELGALAPPEFQPDTVAMHYAMGWLVEEFRDGRHLVWHSGGIDGFATLVGFLPEEGIGFAFMTNLDRGGGPLNLSLQASLLGHVFGLNRDLPGFLVGAWPQVKARTAELAARSEPVDPKAITPLLGFYEDGFRVRLDDSGGLTIEHGLHTLPLRALPDGTYVVADGPGVALEQPVTFTGGPDGAPVMEIGGFAPVRWLTGG